MLLYWSRAHSFDILKFAPFVKPSEFVLALLIPFASSFEIILVMESAADGTSPRKTFRDVLPLHPTPPELDNEGILLWRPFALFLNGLVCNVRRHAAPTARHKRWGY